MKIIHTGDIHIGSAMKNLPREKAQLRKAEILDGFKKLCLYAKEHGVTAVLLAGDLFDENRVSPAVKRQTLSFIAAAKPVCFFYVSGNHDDEFDTRDELPDNFFTFSRGHGWQAYALGEGVTVTGIDTKNISPLALSSLALDANAFNIVLMHGDIKSEIPLASLQNKYIDYLALGHIHIPTPQAERLDMRGKYRYCGCPEGRGFDEIGKRGFFLLEIANGGIVNEKFLSFARREIVEKRVDISACRSYFDLENAALNALQNENGDNMIRLVLCGTFEAGLKKDTALLSTRLSERFFFVKTVDESRLFLDPKTYENDLTERGEFVREVGRYEMNESLREEILEVGLKALAGEEIDL